MSSGLFKNYQENGFANHIYIYIYIYICGCKKDSFSFVVGPETEKSKYFKMNKTRTRIGLLVD